MSRRTHWGTASGRTDVRDLDDEFLNAEHLRMERMRPAPDKGRAGTKPAEGELVPAVWGTLVQEAIRRDAVNGYYVVDRTLMEGQR
jgi:hypothetical protein